MNDAPRLTRAVRFVTAFCGALVFLGAYTIAFAQEHSPNLYAAGITHTNIAFRS